jgi:hypothetical protein
VFDAVDTGAGLKTVVWAFSYGFFFPSSFLKNEDGVEEIERPAIVVVLLEWTWKAEGWNSANLELVTGVKMR